MNEVDKQVKMEQFKKNHQKKELLWDLFWIGLMLGGVVLVEVLVWDYYSSGDKLNAMILTAYVVVMLFLAIVRPIDGYLRRTALKGYWIEDHGDVIKLFGSVRLTDISYAYQDILKNRPGFIIVDDAYNRYGCTLAAIEATKSE